MDSDSRITISGFWIMDYVLWILIYGLWIMIYGLCFLDYDLYIMIYGLWFMDYGLWVMVSGLWLLDYDFGAYQKKRGQFDLLAGTVGEETVEPRDLRKDRDADFDFELCDLSLAAQKSRALVGNADRGGDLRTFEFRKLDLTCKV